MHLIDTAPLRDQRTMVGVTHPAGPHETVDDVKQAWAKWAVEEGLTVRRRNGDYSTELRTSRKVAVVYVSGGKWIADCPNCNGGIAAWPYHDRGCCLDCGTIFPLDYPDQAEIDQAVPLLAARVEEHRNWHRHKGEPVEHLEVENRLLPQMQAPQRVTLDVGELRDVLSKKAFREMQEKGLLT